MPNAGLPPTTVIIPTRGRHHLAFETVQSIARHAWNGVEIVVVDQSETSNRDLAGRTHMGPCRLTYLHTDSVGVAPARNEGIAAAANDLLVFADDDVLATTEWLLTIVRTLLVEGEGAVITGRVTAGAPERPGAFVAATAPGQARVRYAGRLDKDVLAGGNFALFRSAFGAIGTWDERLGPGTRFPAAEDNDLGLRLLEGGFKIVYEPGATLVHRSWRPKRDYVRMRWRYGKGKGGFYMKHRRLRHLRTRMRRDLVVRLRRIPLDAVRGRARALGDLLYVAGTLAGATEWLLFAEQSTRRTKR